MFLLLQGKDSASGTSPEPHPYPRELIICNLCLGREWREMIPLCYKRSCETDELGLAQCSKAITAQPGTAQVCTTCHAWHREPCVCPCMGLCQSKEGFLPQGPEIVQRNPLNQLRSTELNPSDISHALQPRRPAMLLRLPKVPAAVTPAVMVLVSQHPPVTL